ncbi:MAG: MotA/TolQ/ExbB proton channel family protein [Phycisphaerae bacterium]|nr:MotA/TolQ/ExbB proton channel family protein [Phycisphaerae bacterium]
MDIATIIGLVMGCGLITWAILSQTGLNTFVDPPSIAIVFGGATSAALISFPIRNVIGVAKVVKTCFFSKARDPHVLISDMVRYAEVARRDGILALENVTQTITDPFLVSGIQMAVDGTDPDLIENIMMNDLEAVEQRHAEGKALFDNLGKYAPAFGMIGTLIGLVIMLKNMSDPESIGPAMAVALLTTFYGALLANLMALPMADKLALRSREELLLKMIVIKGVMAIQSGDNPRIVEQKLKTFLPHRARFKGEEAGRESEAA